MDSPNFLDIALAAAKRGLKVVPLRGKAPFLPDWIKRATADEDQIRDWADEFPHANCGAVAGDSVWMLDVDEVSWFMENAPGAPPKTLVVQTGSGKLHLYFKHDDASRKLLFKAVMNPKWVSKEATPNEPQKFMEYPDQVVAPGSVHPDTKKAYKVIKDEAISVCPKEWLDWLKGLERSTSSSRHTKVNPLRRGWDPEAELAKAGLKYERSERDGKVYFNYHSMHGKCLVRGASHAGPGETPNPRQSAFVFDPRSGEFWHQCFSGGCQVPGKTRIALEALGLKLEDAIQPAWVELFESPDDFKNAKPLSWAIEGLAEEESMHMIGGLSGQGKTWIALSVVKALLTGEKLFDNFACISPPNGAMYLIPEVGRRSFWKRIKLMRMERLVEDGLLIVRTLSMGPVVPLTDKRMLQAAKGRDVFLDTAVRFMEGQENDAQDNNLSESGFALLAAGARTWWGIHHSPKGFVKETSMTLEGVLRGTGDIGAMLGTCYGIRQLDAERNLVHVECVKGRDLDELPRPFQIEGRPWIEREGRFHMVRPPGECGFLDEELARINGGKGAAGGALGGRPKDDDRANAILGDHAAGLSAGDIALKHKMTKNAVYKVLNRAKKSDQEDLDDKPKDF